VNKPSDGRQCEQGEDFQPAGRCHGSHCGPLVIQLASICFAVRRRLDAGVFFFIPRASLFGAPNHVLRALADVDGDELAAFLNTAQYSWWTPLSTPSARELDTSGDQ